MLFRQTLRPYSFKLSLWIWKTRYYRSISPVYRTCCSCITVKRRRKCDMIQCFNTLLDIIKKPIHGYIYQFIWHKKQQHQNSCEENNANTTASLVRSGFFFLCEILQPYSHVLKYILSDTRAESVSSLILDRTLVQKPPPLKKRVPIQLSLVSQSTNFDTGFQDFLCVCLWLRTSWNHE